MPDPFPVTSFLDALRLAALQHQDQRRKGADDVPYVNHVIKVAHVLADVGGETDPDLLTAAVLHDVVEDSETTHDDLAARYGERVARIVLEVTDDMRLPRAERKRLQIEVAPTLSHEARLIRIADKGSNTRDMMAYAVDWSDERKREYIRTAVALVDRIRGTHPALEAWFDRVVADARNALSP